MRRHTVFWFALLLFVACSDMRAADQPATNSTPSTAQKYASMSIEELMNVSVTTVSRREQRLSDVPAAVSVLSNDDIRRSGATTVPDALRLVPGLQVASIDSDTWAISARGFNSPFANKLLVMLDGRTVYSPLFSGVYWDAQQMLLDDVDRIEVVRGPGATVWGANAVNGVIDVVSKSARDTQGSLLYAGAGDVHETMAGSRYGAQVGDDTYYRVYGLYQLNDEFRFPNGQSNHDEWDLAKGGFRLDHYTKDGGQATWQGDVYGGTLLNGSGDLHGFNTIGRWTQQISERSSYEVQAFFDRMYRADELAELALNTADIELQHTFGLGERNDVIWGIGYRYTETDMIASRSPGILLADRDTHLNLFNAFVQDEFKVIPGRLAFTIGTKVEHNDFTGFEVQPSARLTLKASSNQTIWAAASRAMRTPSEAEAKNVAGVVLSGPVVGPGGGLYLPTVYGDSHPDAEQLLAYEIGYRAQPHAKLSVDLAGFYNDYTDLLSPRLKSVHAGTPVGVMRLDFANTMKAESYGGEASATFAATDQWRLTAGYSLLFLDAESTGGFNGVEGLEHNAPTHQVVLRSSYDFTPKLTFDCQLRYVDNVQAVPAYLTMDIRLAYRISQRLEISLTGQNLLDDSHPEQASQLALPTVEVPRGIYGKMTLRF